jgi:hypothetical protein
VSYLTKLLSGMASWWSMRRAPQALAALPDPTLPPATYLTMQEARIGDVVRFSVWLYGAQENRVYLGRVMEIDGSSVRISFKTTEWLPAQKLERI